MPHPNSRLAIRGATLITPTQTIPDGAVLVEAGRIKAAGPEAEVPQPADAERIDAAGQWLAPGFIDLQLNGAFGYDFTAAPDRIWDVAARLPQYGVTAFLPTIITSPASAVAAAQAALLAGPPPGFRGAQPLGLHLEGPFLNPQKRGAHPPAHLRPPSLEAIASWSPERGVRLVTLAPELPGALEVVHALVDRGVRVAAGHSMACLDEARAGVEAGIRYGTHLFNAMPPLDHREPGLAGALLADPGLMAGVIADGVHLHPEIVSLIWRAKGQRGVNLVTDAMAALGMPAGRYPLGDGEVIVDQISARLADGRLAGSILSLDQAVRNLIAFTHCAPAEAIATVTANPAECLGLSAERGQLAPGQLADLTLLRPDLSVAAVFVHGKQVYPEESVIK